jgi:hypothetical protein
VENLELEDEGRGKRWIRVSNLDWDFWDATRSEDTFSPTGLSGYKFRSRTVLGLRWILNSICGFFGVDQN